MRFGYSFHQIEIHNQQLDKQIGLLSWKQQKQVNRKFEAEHRQWIVETYKVILGQVSRLVLQKVWKENQQKQHLRDPALSGVTLEGDRSEDAAIRDDEIFRLHKHEL